MAVNPDPKPGRWILPLVILGMVAFTYFFVDALPEASPDTTLAGPVTSTTAGGGTSDTTEPGEPSGPVDAETQAYLDELDAVNAELQVLDTDLVTVNGQWDAEPREIEYTDIEARLVTISEDTQTLADRVAALTVPVELENNHATLTTAIDTCAAAADEALEGLRSTDTGGFRRSAVATYTQSASDFDTEVQNTKTAAGA